MTGMVVVRESTVLATDVEETFDLVADYGRLVEWDPGVVSSERRSGSRLSPGSTYALRVRFLGRTPQMQYELVEADRTRRVVYAGTAAWLTARDTLELTPAESGTLLLVETALTLNDRLARLEWPIGQVVRRQAKESLVRLEAICASRALARAEGAAH